MERSILWGFEPTPEQRVHIERHLEDSYHLFLANQNDLPEMGMANKYECCGGPVWVLMYKEGGVLKQYVRNDLDEAGIRAISTEFTPGSLPMESQFPLQHLTPIKQLYVNDVEVRGDEIVLHIRDSGYVKVAHQDGGTTTVQNRGELHMQSTPTGVKNMAIALAKKDTATLFDMDDATMGERPASDRFPAGVYFRHQGNLIVTPPEALKKLEEANVLVAQRLNM